MEWDSEHLFWDSWKSQPYRSTAFLALDFLHYCLCTFCRGASLSMQESDAMQRLKSVRNLDTQSWIQKWAIPWRRAEKSYKVSVCADIYVKLNHAEHFAPYHKDVHKHCDIRPCTYVEIQIKTSSRGRLGGK